MSEGAREQVGHRMRAAKEKHERYPELVDKGSAQLVVLACEVGGRWDSKALSFVDTLVSVHARRAPPVLQATAVRAWQRRWWCLLSVAVQDALAATLVEDGASALGGAAGFQEPFLEQVLSPELPAEEWEPSLLGAAPN